MLLKIEFSGKNADRTEFRYAGRDLKAGDEFEATDKDAKVLQLIGVAVETTASSRRGASNPPAAEAPAEVVADAPRPRRAYRRRDMTAVDTAQD